MPLPLSLVFVFVFVFVFGHGYWVLVIIINVIDPRPRYADILTHSKRVLMRALGFEVRKKEVVKLVHDADPTSKTTGDGKVDFNVFLDIMTDKYSERDPADEIRKAFELFDDDKTGRIGMRNMRRIARELGENLSEEELQAMIDEFDRDQDGEISEEEFNYIMKQSEGD